MYLQFSWLITEIIIKIDGVGFVLSQPAPCRFLVILSTEPNVQSRAVCRVGDLGLNSLITLDSW